MSSQRFIDEIKQLLWYTLSTARFGGVDVARQQVALIIGAEGPPTLVQLTLAPYCPKIDRPDGILPAIPSITDADGTPVGELLMWITDGRLCTLEYAWWHDEEPTQLPQVGQLLAG